jgi:protoheme IX farnesyltransferase
MLPARPRFRTSPTVATLVAATLVGVYLLLVVGVSTALLDGAAACPTWPLCDGVWLPTADAPLALVVAWAHRLVAVGVGALVLVTGVVAWTARPRPSRRVRVALAVGVVVYPIQVAVGALTAVGGAPTPLSALHLALAVGLFTALLLALLWQLEAETPRGEDEGPRASTTGRAPTRPSRPAVTATASTTEPEPNPPLGLRARAAAYLALTKPKLWWLLCLVALASMGIAGGRTLGPGTVFATLTGGVLAIAASGTFNNVLERDLDRQMARTGDRPLVAGDIPVRRAVGFGLALALGSVAVFLVYVNVLAAALGVLAILFYSVVYTLLLKPNTTQNIVVGGAVGAFPALIGWAAVTDTVGIPAVVLGAVIFLWTPAHFYNLAMAYREDYARAGFPMLPVVRGERTTRRHVLLYLGATMLAAIALGVDPRLDLLYAVTAATLGTVFLAAVVLLFRERSRPAAFRAFHASNAYLGCLLLAVLLDTFLV